MRIRQSHHRDLSLTDKLNKNTSCLDLYGGNIIYKWFCMIIIENFHYASLGIIRVVL